MRALQQLLVFCCLASLRRSAAAATIATTAAAVTSVTCPVRLSSSAPSSSSLCSARTLHGSSVVTSRRGLHHGSVTRLCTRDVQQSQSPVITTRTDGTSCSTHTSSSQQQQQQQRVPNDKTTTSSTTSSNNKSTTPYVPLLVRTGYVRVYDGSAVDDAAAAAQSFVKATLRPRSNTKTTATATTTTPACANVRRASAAATSPRIRPQQHDSSSSSDDDSKDNKQAHTTGRATTASVSHDTHTQPRSRSEATTTLTTTRSATARRTTSHCIDDPVEWLAQATDAPLLDDSTLDQHYPLVQQQQTHTTDKNDDGSSRDSKNDDENKTTACSHATAATTSRAPRNSNSSSHASEAGASVLVYNVFTRRVTQARAESIRTLALLGLGVDAATRTLRVCDEAALRSFAYALRRGDVAWPTFWCRGVAFAQLKQLLLSSSSARNDSDGSNASGRSEEDEDEDKSLAMLPQRVTALLREQYAQRRLRQQSSLGVVVAAAAATTNTATDTTTATAATDECASTETTADGAADAHVRVGADGDVDKDTDDGDGSGDGSGSERRLLTLHELNEEQQRVVEFVREGYCTYIGGGAGTGKSVLLRVLRHELLKDGLRVAMTATTGVASCHVGGCTLHHAFGINAHGDVTQRAELTAYDVIIIDEVSMLPRGLFESLERQLRRAHGLDVPFGGVQIVLCGDFLQLGAIHDASIVTSPLFRENFAMCKLQTQVRQDSRTRYAMQLQQLRRGRVPDDLHATVSFYSTEQLLREAQQRRALRRRQRAQLAAVTAAGAEATATIQGGKDEDDEDDDEQQQQQQHDAHEDSAMSTYVEGAVNLLPTNAQVRATNAQALARLPGEVVTFPTQMLSPMLLGSWSDSYLLRVRPPSDTEQQPQQQQHTHDTVPAPAPRVTATMLRTMQSLLQRFLDEHIRAQSVAAPQLGSALTAARHLVLYPLFTDALLFRLRVPEDATAQERVALQAHLQRLGGFLDAHAAPARLCEVVRGGDGLHTEHDEQLLTMYAARSPMLRPLELKRGCRVMLRTNVAPGLVNGSIGTVVDWVPLRLDALPSYMYARPHRTRGHHSAAGAGAAAAAAAAARAEAVQSYAEFLRYECGLDTPLVPLVDFGGGRREVVAPVAYYVGGMANTHYYHLRLLALPLSLAYAFTVHKVQGLTLVGRVHLELSRMWPCDHLLYVAMSRVRNPEQLSVCNFAPSLVRVAAECLLFDDSLPPVTHVRVLPRFVRATWKRSPLRRKKLVRLEQLRAQARRAALHRARQVAALREGSSGSSGSNRRERGMRRLPRR